MSESQLIPSSQEACWVVEGLNFPLCSHDGACRGSDGITQQSWNKEMLYVTFVSTLSVSLESWSSSSWTSTLESYTESSIMDPTPRTARPDRCDTTFACGGERRAHSRPNRVKLSLLSSGGDGRRSGQQPPREFIPEAGSQWDPVHYPQSRPRRTVTSAAFQQACDSMPRPRVREGLRFGTSQRD